MSWRTAVSLRVRVSFNGPWWASGEIGYHLVMRHLLTVAALLTSLAYSPYAAAQDAPPPSEGAAAPAEAEPDFTAPIALHVTAALAGVVGSAGLGVFPLWSIVCDLESNTDCTPWDVLTAVSVATVSAGIILGIIGSVLHAETRGQRRRAALPVVPLAWVDPLSGGGGLDLRVAW